MNPASILLVDDDRSFRDALGSAFQQEGFVVFNAMGGREALERLHAENPQFLILSLQLADSSGEHLLRSLRQDPPSPDLVVFVLSNSNDLETKLGCLALGAHEFLVKPIDNREVVARVRRFLRMIDEFRRIPGPQEKAEQRFYMPAEDDRSHGTVDVGPASDSFVRIRPNYGMYRVENLIGSGGMGFVFKAYEESLDRFVAIKILSRKLSHSPEFVQRFRHEAKILASVNHPGIAFIYSFGEEEGDHYFAMQWCSGGSLADLVRRKGRLELLPALDIVLQCTQALDAASRKGIVHRDIKPSNLLFDENQQVKIVDFGLALVEKTAARITQVQEFMGTPSFMAPEQAQSSSVDHRADIYALGITFYYMLYGKHPFEAASAIEMLIKHASEPFPQYDDLGGKVPGAAYHVITRMTQKSAEDRYPDYPSLIADLEKLRNDLLRLAQWKIPKAEIHETERSIRASNLFELLSSVFAKSASGVLTATWSGLRKKFLLRQREIVLFESTQPDENIWNELIRRRLLEPGDVPPAEEGLEKSLNRFLLKNAFSIEDFKSAFRHIMKDALMQIFHWPEFHGVFQYATIEHDSFTTIRLGDVLLEGARSILSDEAILSRFASSGFQRTSQFDLVLASLDLRPEESYVAYRVEGPETTLNTLQALTGLPEDRIARFLFALEGMGAIQIRAVSEKRAPRRPEAPAVSVPSRAQPIEEPPSQVQPDSGNAQQRQSESDSVVRMELQKTDKRIESEHHIKVAEQFFRLAQEKFAEMDFWKVTELCKQAIRHNPLDARYYHLMAKAYAQHPRFGKDAEQCFYKALEIDPWNPDFQVDLANFYLHQGLPTRAQSLCEKVLKAAPEHIAALELLSIIDSRK